MKKKVYEYFEIHPGTTHHQCAIALEMNEMDVLKSIDELVQNGYLILKVLPLGNSIDPDCSNFWYASKKYSE